MIKMTVEDLDGDQGPGVAMIEDDYILVCAGSCYLDNTQAYPSSGTHVLTIKGRKEKP